MRWYLFALLLMLSPIAQAAQSGDGIWSDLQPQAISARAATNPLYYRPLQADQGQLQALLATAPLECTTTQGVLLTLPLPDGSYQRFRVEESPIMEPGLAAQYPEIKTYHAQGVDDPAATARLDLTPKGFHAMITRPGGTVFIDPESQSGYYRSYSKRDFTLAAKGLTSHAQCQVAASEPLPTERAARPAIQQARTGPQLRKYRLAVAANHEYTQFHGDREQALAAIVTTINRLNQIYGRDLAVGFVLVSNNSSIIYPDAASDPYDGFNDNANVLLVLNQTNLDSVIGPANYDIGHIFSTGSGGLASVASACGPSKAQGNSGQSSPTGDPFDIDFVAHELGHQLNADHTFNGTADSCLGNREAATAYEPGSGSTIMGYAGICGVENLQSHSDATFHAGSIQQINAFVSGAGNCFSSSATGNTAPMVNAGADYTIPQGTPFTLTGGAADPDLDTLSYQWDEMDTGVLGFGVDNGSNPLFRSFLPKDSPVRNLPRMSTLLSGATDNAEFLPTTNRTLNFRLTARDGRYGVDEDDMRVTVNNSAGPFRITSLVPGTLTYNLFDAVTINWDVANTTAVPVSCANVDIELLTFSANGGSYCATLLADDTPNDGSQVISISGQANSYARFRVSCSNNIFFNISDQFVVNAATDAATDCITTDGVASKHGSVYVDSTPPAASSGGSGGGGGAAYWLLLLGLLALPFGYCRQCASIRRL